MPDHPASHASRGRLPDPRRLGIVGKLILDKAMTVFQRLLSRSPFAKASRLFSRYLFSYLAIVCTSMLMGVVTYSISVRVIESEVAKAHYGSLKQVQKLDDSILNDLKAVYIQIGFDQRIQFLMSLEGEMTTEQLIESARTVDVLRRCRLANGIVKEIYLYMDRSSLVLTSEGKYAMDTFYESIFPHDADRFRQWITSSAPGFILFPGEGGSTLAAYVEPMPIGSAAGYLGRLVVILDEELLVGTMNELQWMPESRMLIIDEKSQVVAQKGTVLPDFLTYGCLDKDTSVNKRADLVMSSILSEVCGWKYVSLIPTAVFFQKAKLVKNVILLCLLVFLSAGIGVSWHFAKRQYGPVDKLIRFIQDNLKKVKTDGDDEYHFIQTILDDAQRERAEYLEDRNRQTIRLRNEFLVNLSNGRLEEAAVEEMKGFYGIDLDPRSRYVALLIAADDSGPEEGQQAAGLLFVRTMSKLIRQEYGTVSFRSDNLLACLVNAGPDGQEAAEENVHQAIAKAMDLMNNRLRMAYSVSVSNCHEGYSGIRTAFREAEEAMDYIALLGREACVFFRDLKPGNGNTVGISFQRDLELFSQSVAAKDTTNAARILGRIFNDWIEGCSPSANLIRHRMNQVIGSFIAAMEDLALAYGEGFPETLPIIDNLMQCRSQAELHERIREYLDGLERFIRENDERTPELQQRVVRYMNDNYWNSSVNVSAIAETFSVGIPSLSRLFKKSMGIGPLEYLQLLRVQKAKKLLEDGDETLTAIIGKVGFDSDQSFIRVFKKFEGITPGLYRKQVR
jgi:two-component system, response regulator YesN